MRGGRPWRAALVIGAALAAVDACTGVDTPFTPSPDVDAGGAVDGGAVDAATVSDAGIPADGSANAADGSANADSGAPFDAGTPLWTASTLPAGATELLGTTADTECKFEAFSVQTAVAPPKWELFLRKVDAPGVTCNQPKGVRALGSSYSAPTGSLLRPLAAKQLVIAYSIKLTASGASPTTLQMSQVDWWSGNDTHVAKMKTKAVVGEPVTPSLTVGEVFFGDASEEEVGTVRLKGLGAFPGETGTGAYFSATYVGFIVPSGAPASAADSCIRID